MFDVEIGDGSGRRSFWMHPSVPLQFHFFGSRSPRINRLWIEELMQAASGPNGLTIVPEPAEDAARRGVISLTESALRGSITFGAASRRRSSRCRRR